MAPLPELRASSKTVLHGQPLIRQHHSQLALTRGGVVGRSHGDTHVLTQTHQLVLECLVAPKQFLDRLVATLLALEVLELTLQTVDVLLRPSSNRPLRLSIVGPLAGEL